MSTRMIGHKFSHLLRRHHTDCPLSVSRLAKQYAKADKLSHGSTSLEKMLFPSAFQDKKLLQINPYLKIDFAKSIVALKQIK